VIGRARHLQDDRLFDCYLAERGGEPIDPPAAVHLADCDDCRTRYVDLAAFMGGLRSEADEEGDAVFPPDHLRAQQQQIAHRLDHLGHAARVISFPSHQASGHSTSHGSRLGPRWIAAAAAAGLFVGVGVGNFFQAGVRLSRARQTPPATSAPVTSGSHPQEVTPRAAEPGATDPVMVDKGPAGSYSPDSPDSNDQFLSELELALERPRTRELLALDDLTPRVREVAVSNRMIR
jgi:hypothetical protein